VNYDEIQNGGISAVARIATSAERWAINSNRWAIMWPVWWLVLTNYRQLGREMIWPKSVRPQISCIVIAICHHNCRSATVRKTATYRLVGVSCNCFKHPGVEM